VVTANQSQPPNELKVRDVREARILDTPDHSTREREAQHQSSLFDVLKIIRDTKAKKSSLLDDKYKRFSMNNFEEIKSSVEPFIDLILKEQKETNCPSDNHSPSHKLDKSRSNESNKEIFPFF